SRRRGSTRRTTSRSSPSWWSATACARSSRSPTSTSRSWPAASCRRSCRTPRSAGRRSTSTRRTGCCCATACRARRPGCPASRPGGPAGGYRAGVRPRGGWGSRSIRRAADAREAEFFVGYVDEPVMVQRRLDGPEFSVDLLCDLDGRCLNAILRTMLESRGGESIKGAALADPELIELGRAVSEALSLRGPATIQMFRDAELGLRITDINARFGGAFACPMYAALPGRTYFELIVRLAQGERIEPHVGEFLAGRTFTRFFWQIELGEDLEPTGRDIVPDGPRPPR